MGFPLQKMARRLATLWQLLLEACGLVDQREVARPVEGEKKSLSATGGVKTCDWNAKQERKAEVANEGAKAGLS